MQLVGMIKLLSGGLQKKFGGPKRPARTALEDGCNGKKRFLIFDPHFALYFSLFSSFFFKKVKTGDFVSWFSPWKMCWSKKWSTPRWTARKKQENSHLSFFILETLSQRFLQNIFRHFQFFEKIKNDEFAVKTANFVSRNIQFFEKI